MINRHRLKDTFKYYHAVYPRSFLTRGILISILYAFLVSFIEITRPILSFLLYLL
jgi:hypothetical protein